MSFRKLSQSAGLGFLLLLTTSCGDNSIPPPRTYPMGERVQLGRLIYTVFETQWFTHLGEGPNARVPQRRYMLLRVSITNSGASEVIVPGITLVDESGQTYNEVGNGEGVPQWIGLLRQVKPAESAQGNLLFDVAPQRYKLQIADEAEQRTALVEIPLTFGAETPDLPAAGTMAPPQLSSPSGEKAAHRSGAQGEPMSVFESHEL